MRGQGSLMCQRGSSTHRWDTFRKGRCATPNGESTIGSPPLHVTQGSPRPGRRGLVMPGVGKRRTAEEPDHRFRRLLPARGERPGNCRTAEKRDEIRLLNGMGLTGYPIAIRLRRSRREAISMRYVTSASTAHAPWNSTPATTTRPPGIGPMAARCQRSARVVSDAGWMASLP